MLMSQEDTLLLSISSFLGFKNFVKQSSFCSKLTNANLQRSKFVSCLKKITVNPVILSFLSGNGLDFRIVLTITETEVKHDIKIQKSQN